MAGHITTECAQCQGNGLEPVFEHVSFPVYAPDQQTVKIEPYEQAAPRNWEEGEVVHRRYAAYRTCSCPSGQARIEAQRQREKPGKQSRGGWARGGSEE